MLGIIKKLKDNLKPCAVFLLYFYTIGLTRSDSSEEDSPDLALALLTSFLLIVIPYAILIIIIAFMTTSALPFIIGMVVLTLFYIMGPIALSPGDDVFRDPPDAKFSVFKEVLQEHYASYCDALSQIKERGWYCGLRALLFIAFVWGWSDEDKEKISKAVCWFSTLLIWLLLIVVSVYLLLNIPPILFFTLILSIIAFMVLVIPSKTLKMNDTITLALSSEDSDEEIETKKRKVSIESNSSSVDKKEEEELSGSEQNEQQPTLPHQDDDDQDDNDHSSDRQLLLQETEDSEPDEVESSSNGL